MKTRRFLEREGTEKGVLCSVLAVCSCSILFLLLFSSPAIGHEVRPAYLELRQTGPETYDALWKVPGRGEDLRLGLYVELPASCTNVTQPRGSMANNACTERWTVKCEGELTGGTIHIAGLTATTTDVLVRLERLDGTTQVTRLTPSAPSFVVEAAAGVLEVIRTYIVLGVEHILTGIDHLLFVLALLIITRGGWKLVKTVSAFTLSHSITLSAATLGFVHVPQRPVEAVIALSIVFVAAEVVRMHRGLETITARAPWLVALTFGLMHGLGFASGLREAGLPQVHIPAALLFFSVGIESGHFLFIGAVLALIAMVRRIQISLPRWAELVPPYAIGSVAMFWFIQRTLSFLT
jgi:hydrogenase/urease accessory protein HupE